MSILLYYRSSISGIRASSSSVLYSASKHALTGMVKTTAAQFASQGIRVNNCCPGYVPTEMTMGTIFNENASDIQKAYYNNVQPVNLYPEIPQRDLTLKFHRPVAQWK